MGNFYTNFTVKTDDADAVANSLKAAGRKAFISPPSDGYVVVYEAESEGQSTQAIEAVGIALSQSLNCPVMAILNHDDDIFCYWLCDGGKIVDTFNSCPDYFDDNISEDRGGDVELLCSLLQKPDAQTAVERILHGADYDFAFEQHEELCASLGLPQWAVGASYSDINNGGAPQDLPYEQIRRT